MELRVLRYFLAVAKEESISGAAEFLHVTQPTLSRQIMELEKELGKKLFIRGSRRITLTEEGVLLRKRAGEIIELADKTEAELTCLDQHISGDVCIGGGETDAVRLVARVAKQMQEQYPEVHFHLHSGNANDVMERLDKGLLDFGIIIEPADFSKYDFIQMPATDTWGILMRKDHPLASRASIKPADLRGIPLIGSRQSLVGSEILNWFGKEAENLNIVTTYNLIYNASLMVEEGIGCALCIDKLINTTGKSPLCFRPLSPGLEVNLDIIWKKYQVFSKPAGIFLKKLRQAFYG
jgi:DNA-binding transcriptional LysR family regulator